MCVCMLGQPAHPCVSAQKCSHVIYRSAWNMVRAGVVTKAKSIHGYVRACVGVYEMAAGEEVGEGHVHQAHNAGRTDEYNKLYTYCTSRLSWQCGFCSWKSWNTNIL